MTVLELRAFLGWCCLVNMAMLLVWVFMFIGANGWIYKFHSRWFQLSKERFDAIHYAGMAFFKIAIFVFNLVPYLVLRFTA